MRDERTNERTRGTATSKLATPKRFNENSLWKTHADDGSAAAALPPLLSPTPVTFFLSRKTVKVMRLVVVSLLLLRRQTKMADTCE